MALEFYPGTNTPRDAIRTINGIRPNVLGEILLIIEDYPSKWAYDIAKPPYTNATDYSLDPPVIDPRPPWRDPADYPEQVITDAEWERINTSLDGIHGNVIKRSKGSGFLDVDYFGDVGTYFDLPRYVPYDLTGNKQINKGNEYYDNIIIHEENERNTPYMRTLNGYRPDENGNIDLPLPAIIKPFWYQAIEELEGQNPIVPVPPTLGGGSISHGGIYLIKDHTKKMKVYHHLVTPDAYGNWELDYRVANFKEILMVSAHGSTLKGMPTLTKAEGFTTPTYNDKVMVSVVGY